MVTLEEIQELDDQVRELLGNLFYGTQIDRLKHQITELKQEHSELYDSMTILPDEVEPQAEFDGQKLTRDFRAAFLATLGGGGMETPSEGRKYRAYELDYRDLCNAYRNGVAELQRLVEQQNSAKETLQKNMEALHAAYDLECAPDAELQEIFTQLNNKIAQNL